MPFQFAEFAAHYAFFIARAWHTFRHSIQALDPVPVRICLYSTSLIIAVLVIRLFANMIILLITNITDDFIKKLYLAYGRRAAKKRRSI